MVDTVTQTPQQAAERILEHLRSAGYLLRTAS